MTETIGGTSVRFGRTMLAALQGDLIDQPVEALVLAANSRGVMGAGPAGAVRLAGGAEIEREAMERAPLSLGSAVVTTPGKLVERGVEAVVHAVVAERLAEPSTLEVIRRATVAVFQVVEERRLRSLALPPFGGGTGRMQLPVPFVAEAIVEEAIAHLRRSQTRLERVLFVSRSDEVVAAFAEAITRGRERSWKQAP